jgi:hypothetical protein
MRWLLGLLLLIGISALGGYVFVKGYPYRVYSHWMEGKGWDRHYALSRYREDFLKPVPVDPMVEYKEEFGQLWKPFPLRNALVPLPVRHPLYKTIPIIQRFETKSPPMIGMSISSSKGRVLSNIYTISPRFLADYRQGQELFKLPFVRNRILKYDPEKVWKDVYSKELVVESKSMDDMIYDLYLLYLRSEMIPENVIKYGIINGDLALMEVASPDRDYKVEMINKLLNGQVYTYVLKTDLADKDSLALRTKFLSNINFSHVDSSMGDILYKEFKGLSYARQVDQEGMLYLFSAWSMNIDNSDLMREMVFYLERGSHNELQLIPLHRYAFARFGSTFTTKAIDSTDPEIQLQRMIELEKKEQRARAAKSVVVPDEAEGLSETEKLKLRLKKAKESDPRKSEDVTVH